MEFEKVLSERYSVRSFSEKKVEREKVEKILHAAALAPTAKNNQPQKIFVCVRSSTCTSRPMTTSYFSIVLFLVAIHTVPVRSTPPTQGPL